jgi:hypothetical protein
VDYAEQAESARDPAAELWWKILKRIPTHFGQLVTLSTLRDALTGRYAHPQLGQIVGLDITDRVLRHSHHEVFSTWLRLTLAQQHADLDEYLAVSGTSVDLLPYRDIPPSTAHPVECQLYLADLETLLALSRFARRGAPTA